MTNNEQRSNELYAKCRAMTKKQAYTMRVRLLRDFLLPKAPEAYGARNVVTQALDVLEGLGDSEGMMIAAEHTMKCAEEAARTASGGAWLQYAAYRCAQAAKMMNDVAYDTESVTFMTLQALLEVAGSEGAPDIQVGAESTVTMKAILDRIMPIVDEITNENQPEDTN